MGFEFIFITPTPTPEQWQQTLTCFEQDGIYHRVSVSKTTDSAAYAYEQVMRASWPEDFMVSIEAQGVYLLFHTGIRQSVMERLTNCLQAVGLIGNFEEL